MIALAGLSGAMLVGGLLLLVRELSRRDRAPGRPPVRRVRPRLSRRTTVAMATGIAVLGLTRWPVAAVAAVLAVLFVPTVISTRAAVRQAAVLAGLEQWTRRLSDMLTASRGLEDALQGSAAHAPTAIEPAVRALARRMSARGSAEDALRAFAADVDDPAADRIAAALIIATGRRGGAVRDVLNSLAVMLARDVAARRDIEAERAQHRTTVQWLTVFVLGFTIFAVLNRSYSAPYGTLAGQLVLALITALYSAGLCWLHRLGSLSSPGRFLARADERAPRAARPRLKLLPPTGPLSGWRRG
jgi:Flp pilus assembly protein TadB